LIVSTVRVVSSLIFFSSAVTEPSFVVWTRSSACHLTIKIKEKWERCKRGAVPVKKKKKPNKTGDSGLTAHNSTTNKQTKKKKQNKKQMGFASRQAKQVSRKSNVKEKDV
jgi:hypothetical protein